MRFATYIVLALLLCTATAARAQMPAALVGYAQHAAARASPGHTTTEAAADDLEPILRLLRVRANSDYRHYKKATIVRRIQRRMGITQVAGMAAYLKLLEEDQRELTQLSRDMLIGVSSFFRDAEAFEEIRRLNEGLEQQVAERTQELSRALESLKGTQGQLVEAEKQAKINSSQENMEEQIRRIQSNIKTSAVLLPPIPVFVLGVLIFVRRQRQHLYHALSQLHRA